MSQLTLDSQLRAKLNGLSEEVQVLDEHGTVIGHFLPEILYQRLVSAWANAQVTDAELARASGEPGGRSLAAIWKDLGRP